MKKFFITVLSTAALLISSGQTQQLTNTGNEAEVKKVAAAFADAWNKHDAKAFGNLFTEDADFTNVAGKSKKGRAEIEAHHQPGFQTKWSRSHQVVTPGTIRIIKPDVATMDAWWQLTGLQDSSGKPAPERNGLLSFVLTKGNSGWRIAVMHNMEILPVRETTGQTSASVNKTNNQNENTLSIKESRNKQTALASIEAIAKGNVDEALKAADPGIVNIGNGSIPPVKGIEQVKAGLNMFSAALPIEKVEDLNAIAEGDWVMVWGQWFGSWKGDMMGQTATGKPYRKRDIEIFKFNDEGKIIEHHSVQSVMDIAMQVGLKLPEKKPGR